MSDNAERARLYPVVLSGYDPDWPLWYDREIKRLARLIGENTIARASHYGSTSVPGLAAKPTIDILLEIYQDTDIDGLIKKFPKPEYICLYPPTTPSEPPHLTVIKGYLPDGFAERVFHIHVYYYKNDGLYDEIIFRDYLRENPEAAAEYAALKYGLLGEFKFDRDGYTLAKTGFVRETLAKAKARLSPI